MPCLDESAGCPMVAAVCWTPLFCMFKRKSKTGERERSFPGGPWARPLVGLVHEARFARTAAAFPTTRTEKDGNGKCILLDFELYYKWQDRAGVYTTAGRALASSH